MRLLFQRHLFQPLTKEPAELKETASPVVNEKVRVKVILNALGRNSEDGKTLWINFRWPKCTRKN